MQKIIQPYIAKLKELLQKLNAILDRLRTKIPGLPSNRAIIAFGGLLFVAVFIFAGLQVLLAPSQPVTTYTLPYTQNFDDVNLKRWFSDSGVWTIRQGTLLQTVGGDEAGQMHIPLKVPEDQPYHASVFITLKKDSKNIGLSFNAQYPDLIQKQQRVYISRINPDMLELVSGYIDETGAFVTQAQVPLTVNTTEFRLDLYVYSNTYLVQVNGQRLIENRPLFYKNGMLGFYALGPAIFDTYKVTASENQNPGDMVYTSDFDQDPGGAGWVPINGTWQIVSKQMVQSDSAVNDAAIGYETSTFENYTIQATFNHLDGQGGGILFNMPSPYQIDGAQMVRYSDETDSLVWGYYDAKGVFTRQGFADVSPAGKDAHTLQVFSGESSYDVFLDGTLLARSVPLQSIQGAVGLITSRSSVGFTSVEVFPLFGSTTNPVAALNPLGTATQTLTPVAPVTGTTEAQASPTVIPTQLTTTIPVTSSADAVGGGTAPYRGAFDGKLSDSGWKILNGDWRFANGNFVQSKIDGFDFAAVYTKTAYKNFSIQVGLTHQKGSGAGVIFNLPSSDRLSGASMVRYSDKRDNAIIWGYFDANGVYKNQGYADVPHAGTDRHTIRVVAGDTSYGIYVDEKLVAQSIPYGTSQNSGYFGLLTSRTSVIYDEVAVDGVGAAFKGTYTNLDGFTDQRIVSGKWTFASNKATQTVTDVSDYVFNTGVQASDYTITAKITLPDTADSGGGFILHMNERGTKNSSYIVRLKDGGKAIWWGLINAEGKFKGQGSAPIEGTSKTFILKVVVKLDSMNIFVNDKQVAENVQLSSQDGWIGLLAYGGPVIFEDVKLDVTE
ncbi:MAG: hypothetical protein U0Z26_06540 [Anaerolineales bacterium]